MIGLGRRKSSPLRGRGRGPVQRISVEKSMNQAEKEQFAVLSRSLGPLAVKIGLLAGNCRNNDGEKVCEGCRLKIYIDERRWICAANAIFAVRRHLDGDVKAGEYFE